MESVRLAPSRVGATPMFEIRMDARLLRRYPSRWIVDQHRVKQIQAVLIQTRNERLGFRSGPFRERGFEVGERCHARPDVFVGCAEESASGCQYWGKSLKGWVGNGGAHLKILKISSISESPGNKGFRVHISAKMQPTDHMSTPVEYCRPPRRISGARYQSVTTYGSSSVSRRTLCGTATHTGTAYLMCISP